MRTPSYPSTSRALARCLPLALTLILGIELIMPTVASATPSSRLDANRTRCERAITDRLNAVERLSREAKSSGPLTDAHRATIDGVLASTRQGLQRSKQNLAVANDAVGVRNACLPVLGDFRVYSLRGPQVHIVIVADQLQKLLALANVVRDKLSVVVDTATTRGDAHIEALTAALSTLRTALSAATTDIMGLADTALAVTPVQWNANHQVLSVLRSRLIDARQQLTTASRRARQIRELVRK